MVTPPLQTGTNTGPRHVTRRAAGAWPRDEIEQRLIREVREKQGKIGRVAPLWRRIYEEFQKNRRGKK